MICEHCGQKITDTWSSDEIIKVALDYLKVDMDKLKSKYRGREVVYPRQLLMYLLFYHSEKKIEQIAKLFNRDRTTVIYAKDNIKSLSKVYPDVRDDIKNITQLIK